MAERRTKRGTTATCKAEGHVNRRTKSSHRRTG